jgi:hypothetical protein
MPSSVIKDFEYEPELARLTINFTTGRVYQYFMVPPDVAASFHAALSKGTYFNTRIRDRFSFREVVVSDR